MCVHWTVQYVCLSSSLWRCHSWINKDTSAHSGGERTLRLGCSLLSCVCSCDWLLCLLIPSILVEFVKAGGEVWVTSAMSPTPEKESRPECSTRASESGLDLNEGEQGGLKHAIIHHFASLASTQSEHHGVPVGWSAGAWIARTWADADMEAGVTKLFADLGLESKMTAMKHLGLNTCPAKRTNGFWLPVWKFRLDRDAKNGSLVLSHMRRAGATHF
jgi:hypothetical protein